jgi:probable rRNA maturation factor
VGLLYRSLATAATKRYTLTMPVEITRRGSGKKVSTRKLKTIALKILELVEHDRAELSLAIVDNQRMQELNAKFRNKDYPTDVLSFPSDVVVPTGAPVLGDVIISVDKAHDQAKERRRTLDEEMVTLLIHGILHLLSYDHERSAKDARIMRRLEKKIYRTLCEQGLLRYNNCDRE